MDAIRGGSTEIAPMDAISGGATEIAPMDAISGGATEIAPMDAISANGDDSDLFWYSYPIRCSAIFVSKIFIHGSEKPHIPKSLGRWFLLYNPHHGPGKEDC